MLGIYNCLQNNLCMLTIVLDDRNSKFKRYFIGVPVIINHLNNHWQPLAIAAQPFVRSALTQDRGQSAGNWQFLLLELWDGWRERIFETQLLFKYRWWRYGDKQSTDPVTIAFVETKVPPSIQNKYPEQLIQTQNRDDDEGPLPACLVFSSDLLFYLVDRSFLPKKRMGDELNARVISEQLILSSGSFSYFAFNHLYPNPVYLRERGFNLEPDVDIWDIW